MLPVLAAVRMTVLVACPVIQPAVDPITLVVQPALDPITLVVETLLDTVALMVVTLLDAVTLAIEMACQRIPVMGGGLIGPVIKMVIDGFPTAVETVVDRSAAMVQTRIDHFTPMVQVVVDAIAKGVQVALRGHAPAGHDQCSAHQYGKSFVCWHVVVLK